MNPTKLFVVGTDHRLQQTVSKANGDWKQRTGGNKYRRCMTHFLSSMGVKAICEEAHAQQEKVAPTICSILAKQFDVPWICIGDDSVPIPDFRFVDFTTTPPEPIVGPCPLDLNRAREDHMYKLLQQSLVDYGIVLAVVGFMHAGVLAHRFKQEETDVELFQMTTGLVMDESQT